MDIMGEMETPIVNKSRFRIMYEKYCAENGLIAKVCKNCFTNATLNDEGNYECKGCTLPDIVTVKSTWSESQPTDEETNQ